MSRLRDLQLAAADGLADLAMQRAILAIADGRRTDAGTAFRDYTHWVGRGIEIKAGRETVDVKTAEPANG